jgi:predicted metal-binding protein
MEKKARLSKDKRKDLETVFQAHGFSDFKWIRPENIVVSQWVRMKCTFGCGEYGRNATCPPNVPSVAECERFFKEYTDAAVFHFEKNVEKPEDRHAWSRKLNMRLSKLEREVFLSGCERTFLLFMDSCCICKECAGEREKCKVPRTARPSPESMAMDVFSTVRKIGYPIEPLLNYTQAMNRYAFLMID